MTPGKLGRHHSLRPLPHGFGIRVGLAVVMSMIWILGGLHDENLVWVLLPPKWAKIRVPYFGVLIIRILLFWVLY